MHALTALATPPTAAPSPGALPAADVAVRVAIISVAILGVVIIRPSAGGVLG